MKITWFLMRGYVTFCLVNETFSLKKLVIKDNKEQKYLELLSSYVTELSQKA